MSVLEIDLLGVPEVRRAGTLCKVPTGKTLALLAYLAVEGGLQPREEVAALLWPEAGEQEGRASLRSSLTVLRKVLGDQPETPDALRAVGNAIGLEPAAVAVDAQALATAAALARHREAPPGLRAQLERAVVAARGPLLAGLGLADAPDFEAWLLARRAASHRHLSEALARLAGLQEAAGDLPAAVATLERWARHDPLEERAHHRLLAAHLASGDVAAGLRAYEACRAVLAAELGSEPNLDLQALAEQLQAAAHRPASRPPRHVSAADPLLEPPLVGRAPELVALRGCYAQAQAGRAQVMVATGEMGIGKTRLMSEFLAGARAQGADVLRAQAFEHGDRMPYAALVEALRSRLDRENAPDDLLDDLWLAELARVLPELHERYPDLPAPAAEQTEARLFEAVVRLTQVLAEQRPLVLFLDDVQWTDGPTRELLRYAVRRWAQAGTRVLLLLAVRVEDLATTPALAAWLEQLGRAAPAARLALGPLTPSATTRLVAALTGTEPTRPAGAEQGTEQSAEAQFAGWLHGETGGQPFFIVETMRDLLEHGVLGLCPDGAGGWTLDAGTALHDPERLDGLMSARVQEVIGARLGRLSPAAKELLAAGAALGIRFTFERLCRVAEVPEREALAALDEAVRVRMLQEEASGWYTFSCELLRAVVCAQAGSARRQVLQRRTLAQSEREQAPATDLRWARAAAGEQAGRIVHAAASISRSAFSRPSFRIVAAPVFATWR